MDFKTVRVLEFDKVLRMASSHALTSPGAEAVRNIRPAGDLDSVIRVSDAVSECRKVLCNGESPGIEWFDDLTPLLKKVRPDDSLLEPLELRAFLPLFYSAASLSRFAGDDSFPRLSSLTPGLQSDTELRRGIERAVEPDGFVADEASPELSGIRHRIRLLESRLNKTLEGMLSRRDLEPYLQDQFITQRNSRWVIPVKRDSRGSVPGIVHDISNTGETLFIEPYEVQRLGNELESTKAEEKLEIYRILRNLSSVLRESISSIEHDYYIVVELDRLFCIASFAEMMHMSRPAVDEGRLLKIAEGRHPLLWDILHKKDKEDLLVPLDLTLGDEAECMVITGSNAGGKTVALKTTGVIVLMALSGMHVPSASGTKVPFMKRVLADIGDDQSIEQSLSTFSAHIKRLNEIIGLSGPGTLAIIDELGTGTDPEQGGALSCAILKTLLKRGAMSVVSTHIGMLKSFAHSEKLMVNGSMEMEEINDNGATVYRPTYRLVTGTPGTSHALEIAGTLGLSPEVIEQARGFLKKQDTGVDALISALGRQSRELQNRAEEMREKEAEANLMRERLQSELTQLQHRKKEALAVALREAEQVVLDARRKMNSLLEQVKRGEAHKRRRAAEEAAAEIIRLKKMREELQPEDLKKLEDISEGQDVYVKTLAKKGVIISLDNKSGRCRVLVDGMEVQVPLDSLFRPPDGSEAETTKSITHTGRQRSDVYDRAASEEINIIGQRVDPASSMIERFLNDAVMAGLSDVRIIHGIGTGRLAAAVRDYLSDHPLCDSWRQGSEEEGGAGVTVVKLR